MSGFYTALTFLLGGKRFPEHFWKALASPRLRKQHCKHLDKRLRNSVSQPHITFSRPSKETHVQGQHSQHRAPPVSACGKHGAGGRKPNSNARFFWEEKKKTRKKKKEEEKGNKVAGGSNAPTERRAARRPPPALPSHPGAPHRNKAANQLRCRWAAMNFLLLLRALITRS